MSQRTRLRNLAAEHSVSYQSLVNKLREAVDTPSEVAAKHNWSFARAEAFVIDANFDAEYAEATAAGGRFVRQAECEDCSQIFFRSFDKKGSPVAGSARYCPDCISSANGVHECSRCGTDVLNSNELVVCDDCWDAATSKD